MRADFYLIQLYGCDIACTEADRGYGNPAIFQLDGWMDISNIIDFTFDFSSKLKHAQFKFYTF